MKGSRSTIRKVVLAASLIVCSPCLVFLTSCARAAKPVLSKPPALAPIRSEPGCASYYDEFHREQPEAYYWNLGSPDEKWEVYFVQENPDRDQGRFYSLRLRNRDESVQRILFTLWEAAVGSGLRVNVRWSSDSKAIQISGDTLGFSYEAQPDQIMKYQSFDFVYLVDADELCSDGTNEQVTK